MTTELALPRAVYRLSLALTLSLAAAAAQAQDAPPPADASAPSAEAQEEARQGRRESRRSRRQRSEISAYLEVAQVLSADLGSGGDTLTYTSLAAGADGSVQTRRVTAQMSIRYQRNIEWNNGGVDSDVISGIAAVNAQVVPGVLNFDAGLLATRTGGDGRVFGITNRDASVDVYSGYVGPTLSTHVGPLAVNASYRLGYVKVDDHRAGGRLDSDFDSATAHSATASIGMAPGGAGLPFGWTVGAGYARTDSGGRWDQRFEGMYVRGDVVFPVSPTLAVTAGIGYESFEADQRDFVRDVNGAPVIGPDGPSPDPARPRLLTYDLDGTMYDAGVIWRPSPRTELQAPRRPALWRHHRRRLARPPHRPAQRHPRRGVRHGRHVQQPGQRRHCRPAGQFRRQSRPADRRPFRLRVRRAGRRPLLRPLALRDQRQQLPHARRQPGLLGRAAAVELRCRRRLCPSPLPPARGHRRRRPSPARTKSTASTAPSAAS